MANTLTPTDIYAIVNEMSSQMLGKNAIKAVDTSTFVTVGETLLRNGYENTMDALSQVLSRTIFSARPYKSKFEIMRVSPERWGNITRKVIPVHKVAEASGDWNTDLNANQLADGQSVDMFTINKPQAVQLNFYGTKVLQRSITRFRDQLSTAFQSEGEFINFIDAVMIEFNNDIETDNEALSRMTALNFMAGIHSMGLTEIDLVASYNSAYGTTYTRSQLLTTYAESFMKYVAAQIKIYSGYLTDRTGLYHAQLNTEKGEIVHHTPKERQRMLMYAPTFISAESMVYSSLFNPEYLSIGEFEGVNYWQTPDSPTQINVTPNILDVATGKSKTATEAVNLPYVLGLLYDEEALGVCPQYEYSATTPFNAKGGYANTFWHWRFNYYNDYTENAILFVLGEGGN